jgi:hypothetical protein
VRSRATFSERVHSRSRNKFVTKPYLARAILKRFIHDLLGCFLASYNHRNALRAQISGRVFLRQKATFKITDSGEIPQAVLISPRVHARSLSDPVASKKISLKTGAAASETQVNSNARVNLLFKRHEYTTVTT